jgi:hypothetical protein
LRGPQLLERLVSFLASQNVAGIDGLDADISKEDVLEQAAKCKNPSETETVATMKSSSFDISTFVDLCAEVSSFVILCRLTDFLKKNYGLSDQRCMEFLPTDKERIGDKGISAPERMEQFDSQIEITTSTSVEALIKVYAEFRYLMRKDDLAQHERMDSDDEGVKTLSSGRKRKASEINESESSSDDEEA